MPTIQNLFKNLSILEPKDNCEHAKVIISEFLDDQAALFKNDKEQYKKQYNFKVISSQWEKCIIDMNE